MYVQNLHNPFMANKLNDGFSHEEFICSHWKYFIAIIIIIIIITITNFRTLQDVYRKRVSCVVKALSTRPCKFNARGNDVCWIDALEILWMESLRPFLQSFNKVIRQKAKALYVIRLMWSENVRLEHWKRELAKKVHVLLHFYVSTKCNKIIWNHLLYTQHTTAHTSYGLANPMLFGNMNDSTEKENRNGTYLWILWPNICTQFMMMWSWLLPNVKHKMRVDWADKWKKNV